MECCTEVRIRIRFLWLKNSDSGTRIRFKHTWNVLLSNITQYLLTKVKLWYAYYYFFNKYSIISEGSDLDTVFLEKLDLDPNSNMIPDPLPLLECCAGCTVSTRICSSLKSCGSGLRGAGSGSDSRKSPASDSPEYLDPKLTLKKKIRSRSVLKKAENCEMSLFYFNQ